MSEESALPVEKRRPGRPPKAKPEVQQADPASHPKYKMKAKPNWDEFDAAAEETPDRLRINPDMIPPGMSLQWVTDTVLGQNMGQHRARFERMGWTPVHQEDFDGIYNGMFMPKDKAGEINVEGLVLMARPKEMTDKARKLDAHRAREQIAIKERALRGGDLPGVSLDSRASNALESNRINRSYERLAVPED